MTNITYFMYEMYITSLKYKIRRSQELYRSQGRYMGMAPIGYKNVREKYNNANIIVDTKKASIILELFNAYATGKYSIKQLTEKAHSLGLVNRYNKPVSESCINNMLKNPFYYGEMRVKGQLLPHKYQIIVDKPIFNKVQKIMKSRKPNK